jgi:hypothetical protein
MDSREPFNNSQSGALIEELCSNNDLMQVQFICCAIKLKVDLMEKYPLSLHMFLFLIKGYKQYHSQLLS